MTKLKCCIASLTFATVVGAFQQLNVYGRFGWLSSPGPSQFSYRVLPSRRFQSLSTGYTANNRSPTAQELTDDFEVFLQQQQLRRALRQSEVFQDIDNIELERIVQICELQEYPPNATIFEKGDEGDGMYIVKSGTIEAFDNGAEDRILRNYTEGGIFGELALLFRSPRAATLRVSSSTSSGASLWKFSVKDYDAIVKGNARVAETALKAIERDSSYKTYLEMRQLEAAMRKCKVFRHFTHEDLERSMNVMEKVTFTNGTNIIQQGDVGDAMYFVQSGTAVCIQEKTGEVLSEIGPGGHFGELALLFDQPRAVTVRAKANDGEDMVVWKLNSNAFNEATQDYSLGEKALELLKEKYHSKTLLTTLRRMSFGEAMDLLRSCSRPKKKNVSLHSVISSLYAGMFVLAILPQFKPMFRNFAGIPQIFNIHHLPPSTILQYRICSFLVVVNSVLGLLRIPKNAPQCRKVFFRSITAISLMMWTFGDSNVTGAMTSNFSIDIFSPIGALLVVGSHILGGIFSIQLIDDAICGPNKGRDTVPLFQNRLSALVFGTMFFCMFYLQIGFTILPPLLDPAGHRQYALPFWKKYFENFGLLNSFPTGGFISFGSLLGTLVLEKKMKGWVANILNLILIFGLSFDFMAYFVFSSSLSQTVMMKDFNRWTQSILKLYKLNWVAFGVFSVTVVNALRRKIKMEWSPE